MSTRAFPPFPETVDMSGQDEHSPAFYVEWPAPTRFAGVAARIFVLKDTGTMTASGTHRFASPYHELHICFPDDCPEPLVQYRRPVPERQERKKPFHGWVFGLRFVGDVSAQLDAVSAEVRAALFRHLRDLIASAADGVACGTCMDPLLEYLVEKSEQGHTGMHPPRQPDVSLAVQARAENVSERTLRRHVRRQTGLSPRTFRALMRFDDVPRAVVQAQSDMATTALDHGFADQSHMSREFQRRTGTSPGQFRRYWRKKGRHWRPGDTNTDLSPMISLWCD